MGWWRGGERVWGRTRRSCRCRWPDPPALPPAGPARSSARAAGAVSGSAPVRPSGSHRASLRPGRGVVRGDCVPHPGNVHLRSRRLRGVGSLPCDGDDSRARVMRGDQGAQVPPGSALTRVVRGPQRMQEMHRGHGNGLHACVPFFGHARAAASEFRAGMHPCFRPGRGRNVALRNLTSIGCRHTDSVAPFPVSASNAHGRRERTRAESEQRERHDPTPPRASRGVPLRPAVDRRTSLCALHRRFSPVVLPASALRPWDGKIESASFPALSGW